MDGTNEIEVPMGTPPMPMPGMLLAEETTTSQNRRELPALFAGRGSLSVTDPSRVARHVRDWDIAARMMRFAGSLVQSEAMSKL